MCLSVINILRLISRPCVGALQGTTQLPGLDPPQRRARSPPEETLPVYQQQPTTGGGDPALHSKKCCCCSRKSFELEPRNEQKEKRKRKMNLRIIKWNQNLNLFLCRYSSSTTLSAGLTYIHNNTDRGKKWNQLLLASQSQDSFFFKQFPKPTVK